MARKSVQDGQRAIDRLLGDLRRPVTLETRYAEAVLEQAVRNASGRPTPQAPMAAAAMTAERGTIRSLAGGAPEEVAGGSEFGSGIYRQFQRSHNPRGYWLYPAGDDPRTLAAGDRMLEQVVEAAIRGL